MDAFKELGQFPILQFFGGLLIFAVAVFAIVRGAQDKRKNDRAPPPEQRWFFDGPLVEALRHLRKAAEAQDELARQQDAIAERHREALAELRGIAEAARANIKSLDDIRRLLENIPSLRRRRQD